MARLKVLLAYPSWDNRWIPYFNKELAQYDTVNIRSDDMSLNNLWDLSRKADVLISMWATEVPLFWSVYFPDKKIITYLRRYEFFGGDYMRNTKWENVDAVIFVNECVREAFEKSIFPPPRRTYTIYNAVDLDQFRLAERNGRKPTRIAFVTSGTDHKNFPLAVQILHCLPDEYTVHHIGKKVKGFKVLYDSYMESMGVAGRWFWDDRIPAAQMPEWYGDKDFILSTSITEGNPNNVIEGMACGLKPIVHAWPGAGTQFPSDAIFRTAEEAAQMIREGAYQPLQYRKWVEDHYSLDNIRQIHKVIEDVL